MVQQEGQVFSMNRVRKKFSAVSKPANTTKAVSAAAQRKQGEAEIRKVVDGRSLRATGRTAQFNFRSRADLKGAVQEAAKANGMTVAEWMELAIEAALANAKTEESA
jgi:uncharacterized protein (DUF1778 family)